MGSVTFVYLWYLNFIQKIRKTNEPSLRYLKMDTQSHRRADTCTDKGDYQGARQVHSGSKNGIDFIRFRVISLALIQIQTNSKLFASFPMQFWLDLFTSSEILTYFTQNVGTPLISIKISWHLHYNTNIIKRNKHPL